MRMHAVNTYDACKHNMALEGYMQAKQQIPVLHVDIDWHDQAAWGSARDTYSAKVA